MSTVFWSFGEMGTPHTPLFSFLFFRMITIGWYQDYHFRESSRKTYKGRQDPEYHSWLSRGMVLISKPSSQKPLTRSLLHYSEKNSCLSFPTWKVEIIWQLLESCKNTMKINQKFLAQHTLCKEKKISTSSCTRPCNNREMLFVSQSYENSMKTYESVKFSIWYI